jgi:hypothetical protein
MTEGVYEWPRDLMLLCFQYAALHSTPKIASLSKELCKYTRTPAYWERAVREKLAQRLTGLIDARRLALIDAFHGLSPAARLKPMSSAEMERRVSWMYARIGSPVHGCYADNTPKSDHTRYSSFRIVCAENGQYVVMWTWHLIDYGDFAVSLVENGICTDEFLTHPTLRKKVCAPAFAGFAYYVIDDPPRGCQWRGDATYQWDEKTRTGRMVPSGAGTWYDK